MKPKAKRNKTQVKWTRLSDDELEQVRELCARLGESVSTFIRKATLQRIRELSQ